MKIVPSILTADPKEALEMLERVEGAADRVSIDIIDGIFANNKTVDPQLFENVETNLMIDYQLMVKDPVNWVERCVRGQADRIIGHVEMMDNQFEFLGKVQEVGKSVGLAIDLETPVDKIDKTVLFSLDVVLVMSVDAGFGGQKFNQKALVKIRELNEIRANDNSPFVIQDDGGITLEYIDDTHSVGADEAIVGRRLFDGDLKENIEKFMKNAYKMGNGR